MKTDVLHRYISLQANLKQEREQLLTRLQQIEQALGSTPSVPLPVGASGRTGRRGNPMPLRDAVLRVTAQRPMTKEEIMQAVHQLGYRFKSKDPMNVLGVVLYGKNPRFRNDGGRFSVVPGATVSFSSGRRGISAAGRERIAAAQRARWAKHRGTNGTHKPRRQMSAAGRARIATAAKARWARERAAKT